MDKPGLLEYLEVSPGIDAASVAVAFGVSYATAALLRLSRQGLACRDAGHDGVFQYELTARGHERLAYFRELTDGGHTMKRAKTHTGVFHCPDCMIELDLVDEASLKCDECGGPLAVGGLDGVWDNGDDEEE